MVNIGFPTPDNPNRGWHVWIIGTVMVLIASVFVIVRLAARYFRSLIQMDDWTILAALISCSMFTLSHNLAVQHGYGQHDFSLTKEQKTEALKAIFITQVLYKVVICLTKVSILLLYIRVFSVAKYFTWSCFGMIAFTIVSSVAYVCSTIWQCKPVSAFWTRSGQFTCISNHISWLSYALINIITDFIILLLPVHQVLRLQLKTRDKIAVIMIFMLGGFVCITSIIRTTSIAASANLKDITWNTIPVSVWSAIEVNTGIICACLPMIRQPLAMLFPNVFSMSNRSRPYALSYAAASRHKSRGDRSLPTVNNPAGLPWSSRDDHHHQDHVFLASVKPGSRDDDDDYKRRTESEESIIGTDHAGGNGIMKTTNVSISKSSRTEYSSNSGRTQPSRY
ncbi:hypothetical protein LOZ39_005725 [Ophidiomyces ophidiicola]|uniref:Uncharacterized protein n=1 Tax=Ophidiomyces ophidiicola TaxID=1387563 RepID=A0ACB8V537_9EURO|nr:hypothetical protein LOZ61_003282 [Ophidiomyces ophidiicola]KAI1916043.1 hypothetical protein LOZ64_003423 [Ophidiomyces ophidiicola]KAI1921475.1 hypothetical protein LOZ60_006160 [Ophidiomyces ophidiicola]KAI1935291.1 hypothetical protein LOZ62_006004 [Ophidiomyces ophidiicola]KAI1961703.1 hypothetical protein LOZ59_002354 [Ophidiomyces ophidiicola]